MTKKHHRSGTHVRGHYRGDTWIEEHDRRGTTVEGHESADHGWSIHDSGQSLTHSTMCWWCGEPVFFYRDENGGCVLFDSLGTPWPIHSCWEDHKRQQKIYSSVESELTELGYDGSFGKVEGITLRKPIGNDLHISISGYVSDNYSLYEEKEFVRLHSHRRASTIDLIVLEVFDGDLVYPLLVPDKDAPEYPDYSLVDIRGTWIKHDGKWCLLATALRRIDPSVKRCHFSSLLTVEGKCCSCGRIVKSNVSWGLDDGGFLECHYCGEMRGQSTRNEFIKNILLISEYQANLFNKKTEQLIPQSNRKKSEDWLDDLIAWADENEIPKVKFPRSKQRILELRKLDLNNNQLTSIPESIGNLSKLTNLYLEKNQLTSLPESIGNLSSLTQLFLDNNQLTSIPESIGNLSSLTQLFLNNNQLTSLPESIGNLNNLIILYLESNQLTSIPRSVGNLSNLNGLYLMKNPLTRLPKSIRNLSEAAKQVLEFELNYLK